MQTMNQLKQLREQMIEELTQIPRYRALKAMERFMGEMAGIYEAQPFVPESDKTEFHEKISQAIDNRIKRATRAPPANRRGNRSSKRLHHIFRRIAWPKTSASSIRVLRDDEESSGAPRSDLTPERSFLEARRRCFDASVGLVLRCGGGDGAAAARISCSNRSSASIRFRS